MPENYPGDFALGVFGDSERCFWWVHVFFREKIFIIILAALFFRCAAVIEPLLLEEFGFQRR